MKRDNKSNLKNPLQMCSIVLAIGFSLNLIWENAQAPLYKGYHKFFGHFWTCLVASVVDALVLLLLYTLFAVFNRSLYWPLNDKLWQYGLLILISIGGLVAVWFDKRALAGERCAYTDEMPTVPILHIGLLPLLQLLLLPSLTFYINATTAKLNLFRRQ